MTNHIGLFKSNDDDEAMIVYVDMVGVRYLKDTSA